MVKAFRRVLIAAVVIGVAAAAALIGTARPALDDSRDEAAGRWAVVVPPLDDRYAELSALGGAVQEAGGGASDLAVAVTSGTQTWDAMTDDLTNQVTAANELEGLSRRLLAAIDASERLQGDRAVRAARRGFEQAPVPESGLAYNAAITEYEDERQGLLRGLAADALGYDAIPALDLGVLPEAAET